MSCDIDHTISSSSLSSSSSSSSSSVCAPYNCASPSSNSSHSLSSIIPPSPSDDPSPEQIQAALERSRRALKHKLTKQTPETQQHKRVVYPLDEKDEGIDEYEDVIEEDYVKPSLDEEFANTLILSE